MTCRSTNPRHLVLPDRAFTVLASATRRRRSLTTYAFAKQAGVRQKSIEALERGELVDRDELEAVCRALGLAVPRVIHNALVTLAALLLDSRDRAGLSRAQLGSMACLSDSTIKNIEVAKRPPTRRTCLRLVGVSCLQLRWADVEAFAGPAPEGLEPLETASDAAVGRDPGTASEPEAASVAVPARHSDAPTEWTEPANLPFLTVQIFASGRVTVEINPTAQRA